MGRRIVFDGPNLKGTTWIVTKRDAHGRGGDQPMVQPGQSFPLDYVDPRGGSLTALLDLIQHPGEYAAALPTRASGFDPQ